MTKRPDSIVPWEDTESHYRRGTYSLRLDAAGTWVLMMKDAVRDVWEDVATFRLQTAAKFVMQLLNGS